MTTITVCNVSADVATMAHQDLTALNVDLFPYEPFADRIWQLRENLTCFDAWYVAVAEELGVAVITTDRRMARAQGPRCEVRAPG